MANMTANGDYLENPSHAGGDILTHLQGNLGGGTVSLHLDTGSGYNAVAVILPNAPEIFTIPQRASYKFVLAGATTPDADLDVNAV